MPLHAFVTAFNIYIPMKKVMNIAFLLAVVAATSCSTPSSPQPADDAAVVESAQASVAKDVDVAAFNQMMADHPEATA